MIGKKDLINPSPPGHWKSFIIPILKGIEKICNTNKEFGVWTDST
jgi:hypothetical protein